MASAGPQGTRRGGEYGPAGHHLGVVPKARRALAKGFVFNQANREAAVRITWKQYPESRPRNMSEEDALKNALYVNETRMNIWEPHRGARFGEFLKKDYENVVAFAKECGIVPHAADVQAGR